MPSAARCRSLRALRKLCPEHESHASAAGRSLPQRRPAVLANMRAPQASARTDYAGDLCCSLFRTRQTRRRRRRQPAAAPWRPMAHVRSAGFDPSKVRVTAGRTARSRKGSAARSRPLAEGCFSPKARCCLRSAAGLQGWSDGTAIGEPFIALRAGQTRRRRRRRAAASPGEGPQFAAARCATSASCAPWRGCTLRKLRPILPASSRRPLWQAVCSERTMRRPFRRIPHRNSAPATPKSFT